MQFAGFAEGARRLFTGLTFAAVSLASTNGLTQTLYEQGVQALQDKRYAQARRLLSEAVAADPGLAGAWLDLAIASHADGDSEQAEEFLTILERRFTVPPPVAASVAALRRRIQFERESATWRWQVATQAGAGHDSNANAGLALSDIALTFPGGVVVLPLDSAFQPRGDSFASALLAVEGQRRRGDAVIDAGASVRTRLNANERAFNTRELRAEAGYGSAAALGGGMLGLLPGPWRVGAAVQSVQLGTDTVLNSLSFSGQHAWASVPCSPRARVELDLRRFPVSPSLDSRLMWLGTELACPGPLGGSGSQLKAQLRLGWERAQRPPSEPGGRPGGDTRHREFGLSHDWSWAGAHGTHKLEAATQWLRAQDTQGYSPVLEDNARRIVSRTTVGAAYTFPLPAAGPAPSAWGGTVTWQSFRQEANLGVFRVRGETVQVSLQRVW